MKYGINLYLWADDMHDGLMPVLEKLKKMGYDGVEVPIFDLDREKWKLWSRRLEFPAARLLLAERERLDPRELVRRHLRAVIRHVMHAQGVGEVAVGQPVHSADQQIDLDGMTLYVESGLEGLIDIEEPHDRVVLRPLDSKPHVRGEH